MPAEQLGQVYKTTKGYGLRWRDENGLRRRRSGFESRTKARAWFRDVELPRMRGDAVARPPVTFRQHVDAFLKVHASTRDANTVRVLRERLARPTATFGDIRLRDLERMAADIAEWRATLPERSRYGIMSAFKQALDVAVRWEDMSKNPARLAGANPPPPPRGVSTFTPAEVDAIAVELGPTYGPIIRFAAASGLRPEEWAGLERGDVDRRAGTVRVARTIAEGVVKPYGKTGGSTREVPLSSRALAALDDLPARIDTKILFPGPRGRHVNLRNFRTREWIPAVEAALGVCPVDKDHPMQRKKGSSVMTCTAPGCTGTVTLKRIYDLRSTFASEALAAGVSVFELARIMGTSVRMIERHYGTLLQGSGEAIRGKLDAYQDRLGQERAAEASAE
jgi:integrase